MSMLQNEFAEETAYVFSTQLQFFWVKEWISNSAEERFKFQL